ncbi:MAG: hypothetical protein IPO65_14675 [Saprospiraceae bacterium]|nr:hypothetical protein [Saprospiraceae bacterium]
MKHSNSSEVEPLKIGIMLDSPQIPFWMYETIRKINAIASVKIVALIYKKPNKNKTSYFQKILKILPHFVFVFYLKFEKLLFNTKVNAFSILSIEDLNLNATSLFIECIEKKFSDFFTEKSVRELKAIEPDLLIRFGFRILRGEVLILPKYGIWSLHHGDNRINRGGPACFWEVFERWGEVGATLQVLSENLDGGKVISRCITEVDRSIIRTRNNLYLKSINLIPNAISSLIKLKDMDLILMKSENLDYYYTKLYKWPSNTQTCKLLFVHYILWTKEKIKYFFKEDQWRLSYSLSDGQLNGSMYNFKIIDPGKGKFFADPFILYRNNKYYVFYEELVTRAKNGRGIIVVSEFDQKMELINSAVVLKRNYHLSYPYVFEDKEQLYMIPESGENRTVDLYKANESVYQWDFVCTLLKDVAAFDSSVVYYDGLFWLFTTIAEYPGTSTCDELYLFYSTSLENGIWNSHPLNPIVRDIKRARSAGKIFLNNGGLIRPSQDCSFRYGRAINFNLIIKLSIHEFEEIPITCIKPEWNKNLNACHTYNHVDNMTFIDVSYTKWRNL